MSYEEDVSIDKFNLDAEWVRQSSLYLKYGEKHAEARAVVDKLKKQLRIIQAEKALEIRKDPESFGFQKVTDKIVADLVDSSDEVKSINKQLYQAKHNEEMLSASVSAMEQKKKALENLVSLYLTGYFSKPNANLDKQIDKNAWFKKQLQKED